ncbi:MAG: Plug domain-containing protein [Gemmatimonadaceae bacterium]
MLAIAPVVARAQVVVPPASEVPVPPKPAADSATPRPDTIQPSFGRIPSPRSTGSGSQHQWNRDELFASGALTVADLLERIPGATSFRTGWLASPKLVAVSGDFSRLRIFYDGLEMDNIDPRNGSLLDLSLVQLWTLEHVSVEQLANELKVHLRSWQADRTSPYTRTDVSTGDEDTNIYRGFYGKRFFGGGGVQAAGQQYSTTAARLGGGGDALSFLVRAGVARRFWTVDAFVNRTQHTRTFQPTFGSGLSIPDFDGLYSLAYLRGALGNTEAGPWLQVIASNMRLAEASRSRSVADALARRVVSDTTDTTSSQNQYLLSAGYSLGQLRAEGHDRVRSAAGETSHSPGLRLEIADSLGIATISAERDGFRGINRGDASVHITPATFLSIAGALSRVSRTNAAFEGEPEAITAARFESAVRLRNVWVSAGYMTRDTALLAPPAVFDTAYFPRATGRTSASFVTLRGRVFRDIGVDIVATRWDSATFYQPRYQARSEANLITRWISRFPSGNFGLKGALAYDYRGDIIFPGVAGTAVSARNGVVSALVEIRIMRAVISYQVRNLAGELYQTVPDFFMPRAINLYGVRWEFWN